MALIAPLPQRTQPCRPNWSALAKEAYALVYTGRGLVEGGGRGPLPNQVVATTAPFRDGAYLFGRNEDTPNRLGRWNIAATQPSNIPAMCLVVRLMRANIAQNGHIVAWGDLATSNRCHVLITQTTLVVSLRQGLFDTPRVETYALTALNTNTWAVRAVPGVGIEVYRDGVLLTPSGTSGTMPASSLYSLTTQPVWMGGQEDFSVFGAHYGAAVWFRDLGSEIVRGLSTDIYGFLHEPQRIFIPVSAGGGGTTVALSGVSATFAQTAPTISSTVSLVGESATTSAGILLPAFSLSLSGQAGTASAGNLSPSTSRALSGQSAAFSAGSVIPSVAIAAIGLQATFTAGTLTASSSAGSTVALTGESATFVQTAPSISVTVALTGIAATMAAGILSSSSGTATITVKAGSWLRYKKLQ